MKKLTILLLLLSTFLFTKASQNIVEDLGRKVFNAIKNKDFALFQSLYLNSYELKALIDKDIVHIHDNRPKQDEVLAFYRSDNYTDLKRERFTPNYMLQFGTRAVFSSVEVDRLRKNVPIEAAYFSIKTDMLRDTEPSRKGIDIYSLSVFYFEDGVKRYLQFDALMLPANLTPSSTEKLVLFID